MSTESRPVTGTPAGYEKPGMSSFDIAREGCIAEAGDTANTVNGEETTFAVCNITLRRDG